MFDFAWSEMAVLGVIALVVIGPKDLPKALKTAGFMVRKARMMAREFQNSVDDMIRDSELQEIREQAAKAAGVNVNQALGSIVDPGGEIRAAMNEPLGGTATGHAPVAQEPPAPPPAVEGSAVGELPVAEAPAAAAELPVAEAKVEETIIKPDALPVPTGTSVPDKEIPPETHRNPPAP